MEMHALRDLLIYGNPVAQAAVLSTGRRGETFEFYRMG